MNKPAKTHTLPLNITMSLNIRIDDDGNKHINYNIIGPYGSGSGSFSSVFEGGSNIESLDDVRTKVHARLDEFMQDQISYYSRRENEAKG